MNETERTLERAQPAHSRGLAMLRVFAYFALLLAASVGWLTFRAKAELGARALRLGKELSGSPALASGTTTVRLNGQLLSLNASSVRGSVQSVIDRFSTLCAQASGEIALDVERARAHGAKLPPAETFGVFRTEGSEDEATAACFARPGRGGVRDLLDDLGRVLASGDLGELGQLRYVYARRMPHGETTQVLAGYSHGAIKLAEMFPLDGDAAGRDLIAGVRPPNARRLISAEQLGSKALAVTYESAAAPDAVFATLDAGFGRHGYSLVNREELDAVTPVPARVYQRPGDELLVLAAPRDGRTLVSAFRLGSAGSIVLQQ